MVRTIIRTFHYNDVGPLKGPFHQFKLNDWIGLGGTCDAGLLTISTIILEFLIGLSSSYAARPKIFISYIFPGWQQVLPLATFQCSLCDLHFIFLALWPIRIYFSPFSCFPLVAGAALAVIRVPFVYSCNKRNPLMLNKGKHCLPPIGSRITPPSIGGGTEALDAASVN